MTKVPYTPEQIQILQSNQYVKSCSEKYITFTDNCRITALKLDDQKWYHKDIFRYLWFPDFIIDSETPRYALKDWRRRVRDRWAAGIIGSKKERKKKERENRYFSNDKRWIHKVSWSKNSLPWRNTEKDLWRVSLTKAWNSKLFWRYHSDEI